MNFNKISVKNHVFKKISYASVQNPTQRVGFSWAFDTSISYATPKNLKKSYPTRRNFEILREAIPRVGRPLIGIAVDKSFDKSIVTPQYVAEYCFVG